MRSLLLSILVIILAFNSVQAQRYSDDKTAFRTQVIAKLKSIGTESGNKIAFDFQNAWDGKFTDAQQTKAHQIALTMQKKGYKFYPYFYHFFTYLAYSVAQENLQRDQLDKLLEINEQVVHTLPKSEYKDFLFGLNIYFARRYLSLDKNLVIQAPEGSYEFKLLDEYIAIQQVEELEEVVDEDSIPLITEDEMPEIIEDTADDAWGNSNDSWGNSDDSWGNSNDSWGDSDDSWGNDSWGDSDDSWGDSNDSWGNDSWGSAEEEEEPVYEAPKAVRPSYTPTVPDYLTLKQYQYLHPEPEGPVIELKNARLVVATPYDSLKMKSINGTFILKNRTITASQGSMEWPGQNEKFRGATIQLKEFHLKKDRSDFWTPNASLQFEGLTGAGQVEGVFEFKSIPRPKRAKSKYPIFTSNNADVTVKLSDDKLSYTGGIQLKGNQLFGKAVSRKPGTLKIKDGKGNEVVLTSKEFFIGDSLVSMNSGSMVLLHGSDSIFHKAVKAKYDIPNKTLTILRNSTLTPYKSSYFDININVDMISWQMDQDSIALEIMNAKDMIPATFESEDFFDLVRYQKLGRFLDFHPINAAVFYSRKYNTQEFYVGELAMEYGIDERFAQGAGKILSQYGFADYNATSGLLKLYPKAFHYYDATAEKVDFDNLMVPSKIKNGSNAHLVLDSGQLKVRGVSRFYFTTDFKIYAEPEDSTLTILKGRNLEFDGMIHAGDFQYKGSGHEFDYQEFIVNMPQIDSVRITIPLVDTTSTDGNVEKVALDNQMTGTSGVLHINSSDNHSGVKENRRYPYFNSDSDAVFYFDGKEILNGAYDKSVRFIVPPFEMDSIEREDGESISFEGTFNSGGIFPTFPETLKIQPDRSLGFTHQIPDEGYNLYGTEAKTYEEIRLSNKGMRGYGQIDFLTTTIYSDDFIYYPDSVTTDGTGGVISPGNYKGASYPEAVLGAYDMYWLPRKDSMYLRSVGEPFKFYNSTAELEGFANITTNGVYGGGTMLTRGSKSVSSDLTFKELEYGARHARFEVLTDDPEKPAMEGDDIRLDFDLTSNTATIRPERVGVAAISFPYAQMKTSITEAVWDLEDSVVVMTKPENISIEDSYFYTTREDLDSLAFNAERAEYDINTQELLVQGIPYITVADSKIIPEGNETTILANSVLQEFKNAEIIIDTLNGYHYLDRANIRVISRLKFEGNAYYQQIVDKDTFDIRFDSFELREVPVGTEDKRGNFETRLMTVSGGEVLENQNLVISSGFFYKGSVTMYASKPALELDGYIKLDLADPDYNHWIQFKRVEGDRDVYLPFDNALTENSERVYSGIHMNVRDELYTTFAETKASGSDLDFFTASGDLFYTDTIQTYRIETPSKTRGESYQGHTMIYTDSSKSIVFEGKANFINPLNDQIKINASILGVGNKESNEYTANAMLDMEFPAPAGAFEIMAEDLIEIIERIGPPLANDISLELLFKLANLTNDETAKLYEQSSLKDYTALSSVSKDLIRPLLISGVKMKWNKDEKAWHNTTKLAISNIYENDLNAKLDGFLEIKKDESGAEVVNLFIQAAPGIWYYIGYTFNQLILYSSNSEFNDLIKQKSNVENSKPGELIIAVGDTNETLGFINDFREKYFGIKEPYNLVSPDEINVEDENFETIEKDEDDGFGFD
ncbi:hypothetical protein [Ekhidna sp.]|uniref:hypothetical protein n=1 Tax=Ekhidna sp. TaxID=2608089 RepID=UPI003B5110D4